MNEGRLIEIVAFPGWIVGVSLNWGLYRCWVITPELVVLNDGEDYETSQMALAAGRALVELSLESEL
ncbi:hypothetical protein [Pseudanabaena sp. FACHB-2040]|uniref:hypothetical protein n=1 Tax=Pseudanabaena sp. FACHB-2040 TaxID=2692859 RepID=UPI001688563D|nr:hypothetical protein [Pseudanabaena sp. FACHB-2040]MBD2257535.1 hypothetical protein [Pseudanabaena sp. FACHB-2040]